MSSIQEANQKVTFGLIPSTLEQTFQSHFPAYTDGLVEAQPGGLILMPEFARHVDKIYNFQPRVGDVFIMTFPKSGTTWAQEMVWLILNDCDYESAKKYMYIRSPFLEANYMLSEEQVDKYIRVAIAKKLPLPGISTILNTLSYFKVTTLLRPVIENVLEFFMGDQLRDLAGIERMPSPRVIKTHLTFYLLDPQLLDTSKVVYVARNPKDVIVSYFHYHRLMEVHRFTGDLDTFADYFIRDQLYSSPYFPHLLQAWNHRHHPNMLFLFYEDLKRNLRSELEKVAKFLGKSLTDEQVTGLAQHLHFDNFSKNEAVNNEFAKDLGIMNNGGNFIRKGKTGDWKNHFSPELNKRIDQWMEDNLAGTDLRFITELDQQD